MLRLLDLRLFLVLCLVLTSQVMAISRGSPDAVGQMVICVGAGTDVIYTDASGAPTAAPHFCPECTLCFAVLPGGACANRCDAQLRAAGPYVSATISLPIPKGLTPQTRAPPILL